MAEPSHNAFQQQNCPIADGRAVAEERFEDASEAHPWPIHTPSSLADAPLNTAKLPADSEPPPDDTVHQTAGRLSFDDEQTGSGDCTEPDAHFQSEKRNSSQNAPLRESSSQFLGSLTSGSPVFSPAVSGYPSSASLQSSQPSPRDSYDGASPLTTAPPFPHPAGPSEASKSSIITHDSNSSSSSKDTALGRAGIARDAMDLPPHSTLPPAASSVLQHEARPQPSPAHSQRTTSLASPAASRSPSVSVPRTVSQASSEKSPELLLSPKVKKSTDDEHEPVPHRTPLLKPLDYPPPKETHNLVKDYDRQGNKLINNYEVVRKIGTGAHGTVKLARNVDTQQMVAIKIVRRHPRKGRSLGKHETPEDKVKKEVAVLKKVRHPHVVSLLEVIDDSDAEKVYLVLEFVERGEITWRRHTEYDVAHFEMERVGREMRGEVNDIDEAEMLTRINEKLALHRTPSDLQEPGSPREFETTIRGYVEAPLKDSSWHARGASGEEESEGQVFAPAAIDSEVSSSLNTVRGPSRSSIRESHASFEHPFGIPSQIPPFEDDTTTHASDMDHILYEDDPEPASAGWSDEEEEYRYVPCLTLAEARAVFRDTVLGLEHLHFHGIIHRDIKPANLLWDTDRRVKISDFGVSYLGRPLRTDPDSAPAEPEALRAIEAVELAKTVGTPAFYAPELCDADLFTPERSARRPHINEKIDVWALGVTLYAMIYGRLPFYDRREFEMYKKIAHADLFIPSKRLKAVDPPATHDQKPETDQREGIRADHVIAYESVDDTLHDLLKRLLKKNPSERISLKEVKLHPWVLEGVDDKQAWVDETDPTAAGAGAAERIQISTEDVQEAMAPRTNILERAYRGLRRFTSVVRGRDSHKRAESPKDSVPSVSSSRSATGDRESRRLSLRGEDLISAVRNSREHISDHHPLAQSTLASPVPELGPSEFVASEPSAQQSAPTSSSSATTSTVRPSISGRITSATESVLTIRGHSNPQLHLHSHVAPPASSHSDRGTISSTATSAATHPPLEDPSPAQESGDSSSSLSKLFNSTITGSVTMGRRFHRRLRSRDPGRSGRSSRASSALSSRANSIDNLSAHGAVLSLAPPTTIAAVSPALAPTHPTAAAAPPGPGPESVPGQAPAMVGVSAATAHGHLHSPLSTDPPASPARSAPPSPGPDATTSRQASANSLHEPNYALDAGLPAVDPSRRRARTAAATVPSLTRVETVTRAPPPPVPTSAPQQDAGSHLVSAAVDERLATLPAGDATLTAPIATAGINEPSLPLPALDSAPEAPAGSNEATGAHGTLAVSGEPAANPTPAPTPLPGAPAEQPEGDGENDSEDEGIVMGGRDRRRG